MGAMYVLEIPDLRKVLVPKDVMQWELFLSSSRKKHKKLRWLVSYSNDCLTFQNKNLFEGPLKAVQIDYRRNSIRLYRGQASDEEFREFLQYFMKKIVIRTTPDQMHFLVMPKRPSYEMAAARR